MAILQTMRQLWAPKQPKAYRVGATLQKVMRNLGDMQFDRQSLSHVCFASKDGSFKGELKEKIEPLLFAHTVVSEFSFNASARGVAPFRIDIRHRGTIKRSGIVYTEKEGTTPLTASLIRKLQASAEVEAALMPLDFKHCRLIGDASGIRLVIEHFGGSEVVATFPSVRRYIRITPEQIACMRKLSQTLLRLLATD